MRDYWKGQVSASAVARRLCASGEIFNRLGRRPSSSINFVTAHDGFTMNDVVSYNDKHNEANGEENRDGTNDNRSWNCGVEGPSKDSKINALRARQLRNFLATLLLSQGTPMFVAGDEFARTQKGNNNAYCQDNEISWLDWNLAEQRKPLIKFVQKLCALRAKYPILRRNRFLTGSLDEELGIKDLTWINASGAEMSAEEWGDDLMKCFGMLIDGRSRPTGVRQRGTEAAMLIVLNSHHDLVNFTLPRIPGRRNLGPAPGYGQSASHRALQGQERRGFRHYRPLAVSFHQVGHLTMVTATGPRSWIATYRLQLHADFTLADAGKVLPYLKQLGISHVYLSPTLQATRGSQHGYDVTDPRRINEDLGGEAAWARFVASARSHSLGILLDIVPNHMAATAQNPWWDDVLCHGPYSRYCQYFDIRMPVPSRFCVHICSLARPYGEALAAGELKIEVLQGQLRVRHYDNTWPLTPASWGALMERPDPCFAQLERLTRLESPTQPHRVAYLGATEKAAQILKDFAQGNALAAAVRSLNEDKDRLDGLLQQQFYALHGWKLAGELVNYRRFFDISTLVGLSTERAEVFAAAHDRFRKMIATGEIDGLRVDHPDGLRDPLEYFQRLRALLPQGRIYVEKILDTEERLPTTWPIDGTVGYDFLSKVNRLWMSDQHSDSLTSIYADFTGHSVNLGALIREKKESTARYAFAHDMQRLSDRAIGIARQSYPTRDLSPRQIREALAQITASLGIYRTYRTAAEIDDGDRSVFEEAVRSARFARPDLDGTTFDFLLALLTKSPLNDAELAFLCEWQPADTGGHGQGRGRYDILLLRPAAVLQRSLAHRDFLGQIPRVLSLPERALAAQHAGDFHA